MMISIKSKNISSLSGTQIEISLSNVECAIAILNLALIPDINDEDRLVIEGVVKLLNPVLDKLNGVIEELK